MLGRYYKTVRGTQNTDDILFNLDSRLLDLILFCCWVGVELEPELGVRMNAKWHGCVIARPISLFSSSPPPPPPPAKLPLIALHELEPNVCIIFMRLAVGKGSRSFGLYITSHHIHIKYIHLRRSLRHLENFYPLSSTDHKT